MRGIAAQVGITPNAVYTYVPNKAAVLRAPVERFLGKVEHDLFINRQVPCRHHVEALALELRALLVAHHGAVHLRQHPSGTPRAMAGTGREPGMRWWAQTSQPVARRGQCWKAGNEGSGAISSR